MTYAKTIAALVAGVIVMLAKNSLNLELPAGFEDGLAVILTALAVYFIPNKKKE